MPVIICVAADLLLGCNLLYDCPYGSDDWNSDQFFKANRGKRAEFVDYCETLVSILDHQGRMPGRYIDPHMIKVRFEGEQEVHSLQAQHFIALDATKVQPAFSAGKNQRFGDLPHPVLFYPGDKVRLKQKPATAMDTEHSVDMVFLGKPFTRDEVPRYHVAETSEEGAERKRLFNEENAKREPGQQLFPTSDLFPHGWNMAGEDLELVERGNAWALYNDPSKLSFASDEEELRFWARDGVSKRIFGAERIGLASATLSFKKSSVDVILPSTLYPPSSDEPERYEGHKLFDCWSGHRERVRALTSRVYPTLTELTEEPA